jgi:hypothetical protein
MPHERFKEPARRSARRLLSVLVLVCGCACEKATDSSTQGPISTAAAPAVPVTNEKAAQSAAEAWLSLVDANNISQSWAEAAAPFKRAVDQQGWEKADNAARTPLGKVLSRTLKSARYTTTLPGVPDGEYVVVQFDTSFENKKTAIETVTPMKEPDGRWRVSGYFIK